MHEPPATLSCGLDPLGRGDAFGMRVANTTTSANGNELDDPLRASTGRLSDVQPNPWDRSAGWLRQPRGAATDFANAHCGAREPACRWLPRVSTSAI